MNIKKALIIEPHPDDAILSISSFIKKYNYNYSLLHICKTSVTNLYRDSKEFCKFYKINFIKTEDLPPIFFANGIKYIPYDTTITKQNEIYKNYFFDVYENILSIISNVLNNNNFDLVISPYGITHPIHSLVRTAIDEIEILKFYYIDLPYYIRDRKYFKYINFKNYNIIHEYFYNNLELDYKMSLFSTFYPSETYMVTSNKDKISYQKEIILCKNGI